MKKLSGSKLVILHYLSCGLTSEQIAELMPVAKTGIDRHIYRMCLNYNVHTRAGLVIAAASLGLLPFPIEHYWKVINGNLPLETVSEILKIEREKANP